MPLTRELQRESWSDYLDGISQELLNEAVWIAVTEPAGAPVVEARQLALQALCYDRRDDVFEVAAARGGPRMPSVLRHLIDHPTRIAVDSATSMAPTLIEIDDAEGVRTVITIRRAAPLTG